MNIWTNRTWKPMLLKEIEKPFNSKDYIFEMKYDGIRALCFVSPKEITLLSRNGINMTMTYPEFIPIKNMVTKKVIFDGEIISLQNGKPSFSKLQQRNRLKNKKMIEKESKEDPVIFVVFDILYEDKDLTNLPLTARKKILNKYQDNDIFIKTKAIDSDGIPFFEEIKKRKLEGIVAKLKTGTYHINKRTGDFIKIKNIKRDEFYIGGYQFNEEKISLFLGEYIKDELCYVGKVSITKNNPAWPIIQKEKTSKNKFTDLKEDINYISPKLMCYIDYTEKTKNHHLRHPSFKGLVPYENNKNI